ncbi:hypothetical protein OTK49_20910 [Vibrio coralliirubri]|uniref:hypothetical protein n=1 Tax=Vibrio coralliirubri TaxID=1516159 RepID=UPI0022849F71|nr:hypothetical protein [Vibrio coralliirubri]MCY9864980.1 hypothetical protein [Vibrio coralliirubri]
MTIHTKKLDQTSQDVLDLISELGLDYAQARAVVYKRTDCLLDEHEFGGVLTGQVGFALAKLVLMALKEEATELRADKLELNHPDIISVGEMSNNSEEQIMFYTVRAKTAEDAIQKLADYGVNIEGHRNETDYDCSGQWCAAPLTARNAIEIPHTGVWVLKHWWSLDV